MMRYWLMAAVMLTMGLSAVEVAAQSFAHRVIEDVEFAKVDDEVLKLDLHLPEARNAPLIVWVHGGGWRAGHRSDMPLGKLVKMGYAVASVDYRLSVVAPFPAQAHDIKAAIRFLRAHAGEYGYNAESVAIAGASAGGHLAAIVGVTNHHKVLEGKVGKHTDESSDVQAIISCFGASDLRTILKQSTPEGYKFRASALNLLLGGLPDEKAALAKLASPMAHVGAKDPPLLLLHGDADPQMPVEQSRDFAEAYRKAGLKVMLEILPGSGHGGGEFFDERRSLMMKMFLDQALR